MFFAIADLSGLNSRILTEQLDLCTELGIKQALLRPKNSLLKRPNGPSNTDLTIISGNKDLKVYLEAKVDYSSYPWLQKHKVKWSWISRDGRTVTVKAPGSAKLETLCADAAETEIESIVLTFADVTTGNVSLCNKFGMKVISLGAQTPIQIAQSVKAGASAICSSNLEALAGAQISSRH